MGLSAAIGSPTGDANAAAAIEHLVRAIAASRTALLPLRSVAPELRRAVKNPWRTHGVTVDRAAVVVQLPATAVRSVRLDPTLKLGVMTDGQLGRARLVDGALVFSHARRPTARVEGPAERLAVLAEIVSGARMLPDDLRATGLPASLDAFEAEVAHRQQQIDALLAAGRRLVEAVERLVCALYGLPDELTDRVVQSAISRAGIVAQSDDA